MKMCKCVEYFPNPNIFWYSFDHDILSF
jgi:hypothetical protein